MEKERNKERQKDRQTESRKEQILERQRSRKYNQCNFNSPEDNGSFWKRIQE